MKTHRRGRLGIGAIALVIAFAGTSASALAGGSDASFMDFDYTYFADPELEQFDGYLDSGNPACEVGRTVAVLRKTKKGPDDLIGSAETIEAFGGRGYFDIDIDNGRFQEQDADAGEYYAKTGSETGCANSKSTTVKVVIGKTKNELGYFFNPQRRGGGSDNEFFEGYLRSRTPRCYEDRDVSIFRMRKGKDKKIAEVTTVPLEDGISRYFHVVPDRTGGGVPETKPGKYYSVAAKRSRCSTPKSNVVNVTNP